MTNTISSFSEAKASNDLVNQSHLFQYYISSGISDGFGVFRTVLAMSFL
jgi:hypothetical protein